MNFVFYPLSFLFPNLKGQRQQIDSQNWKARSLSPMEGPSRAAKSSLECGFSFTCRRQTSEFMSVTMKINVLLIETRENETFPIILKKVEFTQISTNKNVLFNAYDQILKCFPFIFSLNILFFSHVLKCKLDIIISL